MVNPQKEHGHLDIANELVEQFARLNLSAYEWRVFWAVLRKTWSWHKKFDSIPPSQISKMTGLKRPHVCRAKSSLIKKKILFGKDGKIGFQKDYELWEVKGFLVTDSGNESAKTVTDSGNNVTNLGNESLPNQGHSKEKKETTQKQQRNFYDSFQNLWNSKANLKRIAKMTSARKEKLKTRMKEPDFANHWQEIIERISQSAFCTGAGERGWRADIDWILKNDTNYVKVLEGKYDNKDVKPLERDAEGLTPRQKFLRDKANVK